MKTKGFTLLEILIALVIFAIIGVLAASSLHRTIRSDTQLNAQDATLTQMQMAMTLIRRDLIQVIDRPVITAMNTASTSFTGGNRLLAFTRTGIVNPEDLAYRSDMQRIEYTIVDGNLSRLTWNVLDQAPDSKPSTKTLIEHVNSLQISFVDSQNKVVDTWPEPITNQNNNTPPAVFPKAVLMTMDIEGQGNIEGVFPIDAQGAVDALASSI